MSRTWDEQAGELARALSLNQEERDYCERYRITSADELHADLLASPSLERTDPRIRRAQLLTDLEQFLSPAYRRELSGPDPDIALGFDFSQSLRDNSPKVRAALTGWPGETRSPDLNDEEGVDLLGHWPPLWPVRDQGFSEPTCVPFAVNACQEWEDLKPGIGASRLGSVFLYQRIRSQLGPGSGQGGTKLTEVEAIMPVEGVCREALWPDSSSITAAPSASALNDAATRRRAAQCADLGWNNPSRLPGPARTTLELLRLGRPVAITIPTFRDPMSTSKTTNWTDAYARVTGVVRPKKANWDFVGGHAVCILGFQPATKDTLGGYFIFRNSWGDRFAKQPLTPAAPQGGGKPVEPTVPARGYGAIGASEIEAYVSELLFFP
ncbi:hypothetical protein J4558_07935 [Leptolyngbya sp. 15MV]|nr:hypothetical protein J4558_07935 [Leptolyngbya sp. 15MV]